MRVLIFVAAAFAVAACADDPLVDPVAPTDGVDRTGARPAASPLGYQVVPLPRPDAPSGFSPAQVRAVNNAGTAVGWMRGEALEFRAAIWQGGELSQLPGLVEDAVSEAWAVNEAGDVAGASENAGGDTRAVLWRGGIPQDLGTLGGTFSMARGLNDHGDVVGAAETAAGELHAFLWTGGEMIDLGKLPGMEVGMASDVNRRGDVVGSSIGGMFSQRATLWRDGEPIDLGTLGNESGASAINDRGLIVGGSFPFDQTEIRAVAWEGLEIRDLGSLDDSFSSAGDVNARGQIVGATSAPDCFQCAVLWDRGSMELLPRIDDAISSATGINDRGAIVGIMGDGIGPVAWWSGRGQPVVAAAGDVRDIGALRRGDGGSGVGGRASGGDGAPGGHTLGAVTPDRATAAGVAASALDALEGSGTRPVCRLVAPANPDPSVFQIAAGC